MSGKNRGRLKILSFNWHEPYLCMLAQTGHEFFVYQPVMAGGAHRLWDVRMRPMPENIKIISTIDMKEKLRNGGFDLAICHNVEDIIAISEWQKIPKIMVFHNKLTTEISLGKNSVKRDDYLGRIKPLLENTKTIFISPSKKEDWNLGAGSVILPGIDPAQYGGYTGELATILRVGNRMAERNLMTGFSEQTAICENLPTTILGDNPASNGKLSKSWDDLKSHYRLCRLFLNTTKHPYEDGYNLAMLEAMATGMPVVSLANPTSPITDSVEGFLSNDIQYLRNSAKELLQNAEKAEKMGMSAREQVIEKFPMKNFVTRWNEVIEESVKMKTTPATAHAPAIPPYCEGGEISSHARSRSTISTPLKEGAAHSASQWEGEYFRQDNRINKMNNVCLPRATSARHCEWQTANVWMDYAYYPATTAHYLKRAFSMNNRVVTSGGAITPEIKKLWKLENMKAPVKRQDVPRAEAEDAQSITSRFPNDFKPEFFLWVETGLELPPAGLETLKIPKAAYLIDSHINLENHLRIARMFNVIFLAQRAYIEDFKQSGIKNVHWLPLACDPEIHGRRDTPQVCDISFAGSITDSPAHRRRKKLLESLTAEFDVKISRVFLDEMATFFSSGKIVFNNAIKNDLNMRVFEALCSGSLLLTDSAEGLADLFEDKKHLALYSNGNAAKVARHYLQNDDERKKIAKAGREEVLAKHTYLHRVKQIIETMRADSKTIEVKPDKPEHYYQNERPEVTEMVPQSAVRILEVGCAEGESSRVLKEENPAREIVGVETDASSAQKAAKILERVFTDDVETLDLPYPEKYFDCIIYADVLEHLRDPSALLEKHGNLLADDGVMVMSIPNARHFSVVGQLMEGRWTYQEEGLLDKTHIHFFTLYEIREMLSHCGLKPLEIKSKRADRIYRDGAYGTLKVGRWQIDNLSEEEMLEFFTFQYLLTVGKNRAVKDVAPLVSLANSAHSADELESAEKEIKKYLELHPANIDTLFSFASVLFARQKFSEAREALEKIFLFEPDHEDAGKLYEKLEQAEIHGK